MYQISTAKEILGYAEEPQFCYLLPSGSPQVVRLKDRDKATGIIFAGTVYNLPNHDDFKGAETATAAECDGGTVINAQNESIRNQGEYIASLEDAMCEADEATAGWRSGIEDALCEIDEREGNNNG